MSESADAGGTIRTIHRALAILRAFRASDRELALGEIARRARLDKGTTRRLLRTLMAEGLVEQAGVGMTYTLGMGVLELAAGVSAGRDLRQYAQPILAELAAATETTTFLAALHDWEALCIGRVDGGRAIQIRAWSVGGRLPLHCGAGPRVLFAHLPDPERTRLLAGPLEAVTRATPTDPTQLRARLDEVRARGWELGIDDVVEGITSLAVPVIARDGSVAATISIAGLHTHMMADGHPRHLPVLQAQARKLEARLAP